MWLLGVKERFKISCVLMLGSPCVNPRNTVQLIIYLSTCETVEEILPLNVQTGE